MDVNEKLLELGTSLTASVARNTAAAVLDRVRSLKARGEDRATVEELSQIITELIEDKNDLARIAQAYQHELVAQRISPGDVQYITTNVLPVLERLAEASNADESKAAEVMGVVKPLLSVETVNVLQLLGFDFRRAIGEPLTRLVADAIASRTPARNVDRESLQTLAAEREMALIQISGDPVAYARFARMVGREDLLADG